jgi:hypothetical protein
MHKPDRAKLPAVVALLLFWGVRLLVCHGCSNGGARLLLPNAVVEPSHDCSALKEYCALTTAAVANQ